MDVIEHIPADQRPNLFANISRLATADASMVLTYPSPEYQQYLMEENPSELQLIDNVIDIQAILAETAPLDWKLKFFSYIDVWHYNQYVHAVFVRSLGSSPKPPEPSTLFQRIASRIDRAIFRPRRLKKYAEKPFSNE